MTAVAPELSARTDGERISIATLVRAAVRGVRDGHVGLDPSGRVVGWRVDLDEGVVVIELPDGGRMIDHAVALVVETMPRGGLRRAGRCPRCARRTLYLYVQAEAVVCRGCARARYLSQQRAPRARAAARAARLLSTLGAPDGVIDGPPPPRRPRAWRSAHERRVAALAAQVQAYQALLPKQARGDRGLDDQDELAALYLAMRDELDRRMTAEFETNSYDRSINDLLGKATRVLCLRVDLRVERAARTWSAGGRSGVPRSGRSQRPRFGRG